MRTEGELQEAVTLIEAARKNTQAHINSHGMTRDLREVTLMQLTARDVIEWMLGASNIFQSAIIERGRQHQRAARQ